MYGKLISGILYIAPNPIMHEGQWWGNPPDSVYETEGYKPVVYTEAPTVETGYIAVPGWTETESEIVQTWTVEEEPDEIDGNRAAEILFGG